MLMNRSVLIVAVMAIVTIILRFIPFIIFSGNKKTPKLVAYLGDVLPSSVMAMLVVYCLKGISFTSTMAFLPYIAASAVVVLSYIWKRNTLLSIVLGTACFMIMV